MCPGLTSPGATLHDEVWWLCSYLLTVLTSITTVTT